MKVHGTVWIYYVRPHALIYWPSYLQCNLCCTIIHIIPAYPLTDFCWPLFCATAPHLESTKAIDLVSQGLLDQARSEIADRSKRPNCANRIKSSLLNGLFLVSLSIHQFLKGSRHGSLFMLTWWWSPLQLGRQEYTNVFENADQRQNFSEFSSSCPQNRRNEECPTKWQHSRGRSLRPRKCSAPSFPPCRPPQPPSADRPSA